MRQTLALLLLVTLSGCRGANTSAGDLQPARAQTPEALTAKIPASARVVGTDPGHAAQGTSLTPGEGHALAAFALGCFWGSEDTFRHVPGVVATAVGYSGGHTDNPTYESVCTHTTGHAETVLVEFDPKAVTYDRLLTVFFKNHDPTTKDRQGPDVGDQYRSEVFTFSPEQDATARAVRDREQAAQGKTFATRIEPLGRFWKAEAYHQQYDEKTGTHSCPMPRGLEGT